MNKNIEIRWHGRGGQGAKTAALLLADAAFKNGKYVQGFPEYGPERMGAPITAFNRISEKCIRVHSHIYEPDLVVVVDETLLGAVDVTAGLKKGGAVIVNTSSDTKSIRSILGNFSGELFTVDARRISEATLGKNFPNTPMLAAVVAISGIIERDEFLSDMESSFLHKFATKPEVVEGNMNALRMTFDEVAPRQLEVA